MPGRKLPGSSHLLRRLCTPRPNGRNYATKEPKSKTAGHFPADFSGAPPSFSKGLCLLPCLPSRSRWFLSYRANPHRLPARPQDPDASRCRLAHSELYHVFCLYARCYCITIIVFCHFRQGSKKRTAGSRQGNPRSAPFSVRHNTFLIWIMSRNVPSFMRTASGRVPVCA